MKKIVILFVAIAANSALAQETEKPLTLKDLEIPTSPGFILLDQAPSSIERPNSPKAFAISAINSFTESNGLPKNYAAEFTPFWFFKHPKMNVLKYAGYKMNKQLPFSSLKLVSLSVAYINKTDTPTSSIINNISVGARTNIIKIRSKNNLKEISEANTNSVNQLKKINDLIVERIGPGNPIDPEGYRKQLLKYMVFFQDSLKEEIEAKRKKISDAILQKPLFALDGAVAYNTFFRNSDFSTQRFGRFGAWATMNLSLNINKKNTSYCNFYVLGRYLSDGTTKNSIGEYQIQNFMDLGGKLEIEIDKFSLAYEYIYRSNKNSNTFRSTGLLKYRISDNLFLTGAFGKNFGNSNNLVSLLGINWGFSTGNETAKIE